MKRALKITGITLGSLLGLVLIALVVAYFTLTSPKRLTRLVQKHLPEYVTFDVQLEQAKLTLKTFPDIGLELDQVVILSPMEGAPSDTLARVGKLTLAVNAKKYIKEKDIVVKRCLLDDVYANIFTNEEGKSNLDIFKSKTEDTTSTKFTSLVDLQEVKISNAEVLFANMQSNIQAQAQGLGIDLKGSFKEDDAECKMELQSKLFELSMPALQCQTNGLSVNFDGTVKDFDHINGTAILDSPDLNLNVGYRVIRNEPLHLFLPVSLSLKDMTGLLKNGTIGLNDYQIQLPHTDFNLHDPNGIALNVDFSTNTLNVEDVISRLPVKVYDVLSKFEFKGNIVLTNGHLNGYIGDSILPVITADVHATDAGMRVAQLPYPFTQANFDTHLSFDLNDSLNTRDITLSCMMNRTKFDVTGSVTDITDDMAFDVDLDSDFVLKDLKGMLPKTVALSGQGPLKLKLKCTLNELLQSINQMSFEKLNAQADFAINNFNFDMNDIHASSPKMNLALTIPAANKTKGRKGAYLELKSNTLNASVGKDIKADLKGMSLKGNADHLKGIEQMLAQADLQCSDLKVDYDTIHCHAVSPGITFETTPKKGQGLNVKASLKSNELDANMGRTYLLNTQSLAVAASARHDKSKKDFFNQWNPNTDFTLNQAEIQIDGMDEKIIVPAIEFELKESELDFKKGGIKLGKSDLNLYGNVTGIKPWMEDHNNLMKAELEVNSNYLDINEIMELTSGLGVTADSTVVETPEEKEDHPFMVPEGFDFTFNIRSNKALYRNFEFNDLKGDAIIKDGTLVLREVGFTNEAARMQLTAMYQSPRKNHLFLGMDFHLVDVQIYDLLHMIPEIDTIVPMLKTFDGAAEFHIAAQTNLKSNYDLKMSTLRAAADIEGANLRVKDIVSFTKITDLLGVSTNGEYKIDSIDIQMTAYKNDVDLWPFQIAIGKYKATLDGHYNLNTVGEYHISVTDSPLPTRLGLKISGPINNLSYSLESCKYPHLYRPDRRNDTEEMVMALKKNISEKLRGKK